MFFCTRELRSRRHLPFKLGSAALFAPLPAHNAASSFGPVTIAGRTTRRKAGSATEAVSRNCLPGLHHRQWRQDHGHTHLPLNHAQEEQTQTQTTHTHTHQTKPSLATALRACSDGNGGRACPQNKKAANRHRLRPLPSKSTSTTMAPRPPTSC